MVQDIIAELAVKKQLLIFNLVLKSMVAGTSTRRSRENGQAY